MNFQNGSKLTNLKGFDAEYTIFEVEDFFMLGFSKINLTFVYLRIDLKVTENRGKPAFT